LGWTKPISILSGVKVVFCGWESIVYPSGNKTSNSGMGIFIPRGQESGIKLDSGTVLHGVTAAVLTIFLFVVLGWGLVLPVPAWAGVAVSDKLSLFGDFRMRYEVDDQDRGTTADRDRDRARLRVRFGFKHRTTDKISFGMRLATEADSLQSPHQTFGVADNATDNRDFGLDQAYIDIKWGKSGFLWMGKHSVSFWEQNEQFWDGDIHPEGAGIGYKIGLGNGFTRSNSGSFDYISLCGIRVGACSPCSRLGGCCGQ
jgi:hypothetical protein